MQQNLSERQVKKLIEKNEKENQKIINVLINEISKLKKEFNKLKLKYNSDIKKLEEIIRKAIK